MKKYILTLIFLLSMPLIAYGNSDMKLIEVHDGDTVTLSYKNGKKVKVRLFGIDAPELAQLYGDESKRHLYNLLKRKNISLKSNGKDTYNRLIATLYVNDKNINLQMIKDGYAWHYERYYKSDEYSEAQKNAKSNKLGLWKQDNPTEPWVFRNGKRDNEHANNKPLFKSPIKGIVICFNPDTFHLSIKTDFCPRGYITVMK